MCKLLVITLMFLAAGCDKTVREARIRPAQTLQSQDVVAANAQGHTSNTGPSSTHD